MIEKSELIAEDLWERISEEDKVCVNCEHFCGQTDGNPVYYEWICSACKCVVEDEEPTWNFCPNCGADMRGRE